MKDETVVCSVVAYDDISKFVLTNDSIDIDEAISMAKDAFRRGFDTSHLVCERVGRPNTSIVVDVIESKNSTGDDFEYIIHGEDENIITNDNILKKMISKILNKLLR